MKNADKFKRIFGAYATEIWTKQEKEFVDWLNEDVPEPERKMGDTLSSLEELFEHYISDCSCDTQVFDKADEFISTICRVANNKSFDRDILWETWTERKIRR